MEVVHVIFGAVSFCMMIAILWIISKPRVSKGIRVCAIIGSLAVLSAAYGGISFVLSGFQDNGNSMQMGGSFIGAYASFFLMPYFNKT